MTAADAHLGTGAMALDCLPFDDAAEFLEHVQTCPTCELELIGFRETAARLGAAEASPAPASLRRSVLAAVAVTPQLPPLLAPRAEAEPSSGVVLAFRRPWYRRPQTLIAAAAAALVLAGGTAIVLSQTTTQTPAASCTQTAPDAQTFTPSTGSGHLVVYPPSCGTARVSAAGLAALPAGKIYQLWVLDAKGQARSVGVMKTETDGSVDPMDASVQPGDTAAAISVENAPGPAASPSKDIVWVTKL